VQYLLIKLMISN